MAIAYDATANGGNGGTSWSHTCTGSDRILFVAVTAIGGTPSCTYNGVAMTAVDHIASGDGSGYNCWLFYLIAPATGANTVAIGGAGGVQGCSASYTGANQSGVPDATNKGATSTSTVTVATTTVLDNCWVVMAGVSDCSSSSSQSAGAGATQRTTTGALDSSVCGIYDSNAVKHPAGSYSMTFTQSFASGTRGMAAVNASFAPVQPVTTSGNFLTFM